MKLELLNDLSKNHLKNDIAFTYWIYNIENIIVQGNRYLKLYLFNRRDNSKLLNKITINHLNKIYDITDFSIVSKYKTPTIVGCVIQIDMEDDSSDVSIEKEVVDGKLLIKTNKLIDYQVPSVSNKQQYYLRKKHNWVLAYPIIQNDYWQCGCGRVNDLDTNCYCGKTIDDNILIKNLDLKKISIDEYLNAKPYINENRSLEENVNSFIERYENETGFDGKELRDSLDLEKFNKEYNEAIVKSKKQSKTIKRVGIIVFIAFFLLLAGGIALVLSNTNKKEPVEEVTEEVEEVTEEVEEVIENKIDFTTLVSSKDYYFTGDKNGGSEYYSYDDNGLLIELETNYIHEGSKTYYYYDNNGFLTKEESSDDNMEVNYINDNYGNVIKKTTKDFMERFNMNKTIVEDYKYDNDGNLLQIDILEEYSDGNGGEECYQFAYENGRLVNKYRYYNNELIDVYSYYYENDLLVKEELVENDSYFLTTTYSYDDIGRMIKEYSKDSGGYYYYIYNYDYTESNH